eukprot:NODE_1066_length_1677_cov_66.198710_g865_i1.p1 GENE.NODE_1066_length_1677_cov_66.198710_g865_i1~~NODE_1066_length_1677_cov_66.198710_g865_i1.p1  ORF type:complete len:363 (-),score=100.06 NODE_1066_length_1677_cov_66.198710_g865_i1:68-1156(-)
MLIGGVNMSKDHAALRKHIHVLLATPGRLLDHMENYGLLPRLQTVQTFVLDEMDRLLDEGFWRDVERIVAALPPRESRQTFLFSATMPPAVNKIVHQITRPDREWIKIAPQDSIIHDHVPQHYLVTPLEDQIHTFYAILREKMEVRNYKIICFFTTARLTGFMAEVFNHAGVQVGEIHSRKSQQVRTKVSDHFRTAPQAILFSSDVTARGMDYPNVTCVIQVGMAANKEQYIHRLGRTARAGQDGSAILLLAEFESDFLSKLQGLPLKPLDPPCSTSHMKTAITKAVQQTLRQYPDRLGQVYVAFLGFYISASKTHKLSKAQLVVVANRYVMNLFGLGMPPPLEKRTVGKMGLKGVPGVRIV